MTAIETGIDMPKAMGDLGEVEAKIDTFRGLLQQEVDEAVEETATEFRDAVKDNIRGSRIERDTGELLNSWKVRPKGLARYEVRSTADHAVFLELGTDAHDITGDPLLVFEPEPGTYGEYPPHAQREDGMIGIHEVSHPGNDAYRYFEAAFRSKQWKTTLNNRIRQATIRAKREAGLE